MLVMENQLLDLGKEELSKKRNQYRKWMNLRANIRKKWTHLPIIYHHWVPQKMVGLPRSEIFCNSQVIGQSNHPRGFLNFQLTKTITWLWWYFPHRLFKHQSQTTVLLRTPITQMIFINQVTANFIARRATFFKIWGALLLLQRNMESY